MVKDYYKILEVSKEASEAEIKKSYRRLANIWHPDKHQQSEQSEQEESEEKFKEISEAYAVLSDPVKKQNYDLTGNPENQRSFGTEDFFSWFRERSRPSGPQPMRGQTVRLRYELPLISALLGDEVSVDYQTFSPCEPCGGRGASTFEQCGDCRGSGFSVSYQQNMVIQQSCRGCQGQGQKPKTLCDNCSGNGTLVESRRLNIVVPTGVPSGAILRISGQGGKGMLGGPPGDLFVEINVVIPDLSSLDDDSKIKLRELLS